MDTVDFKYIGLISSQLANFKRKEKFYNFRCPFCNDSRKNKHKARGYIYELKGNVLFKCHNCNVSTTFFKLIEHVNSEMGSLYKSEKFKEKYEATRVPLVSKQPDITSTAKPVFIKYSPLKDLQKVSQLKPDHPVKIYVVKRRIPSNYHFKLFYAPKFRRWVNTFIPDKFDLNQPDEPRLVIPLLDRFGNLIGIQGRGFSKTGIRYITIIVDESKPKIYGLDHTDTAKYTYLFEGPIDSMFIPNSLAMCGADCIFAIKSLNLQKNNFVFVYDNEPRNKQIVDRIEKMIDNGYRVCLWPQHIEHKDVNDMVMAGMKPADIKLIIDVNTFSGLEAKLQISMWRKI